MRKEHALFRLTTKERMAAGKKIRGKVPRSSHAQWVAARNRPDPIELLKASDRERLPALLPIRYARMCASPFAFLRGAAALMAADLASTRVTGMRVQACGDCHVANFGGFGTPERQLVFDINDFDETLPAPWEWDVKRLAVSIEIAGRVSGYRPRQRSRLVLETAASYRLEMRRLAGLGDLDVWYSRGELDELQARFRTVLTRRERMLAGTDLAAAGQEVHSLPAIVTASGGQPRVKAAPPLIVPLTALEPAGHDKLRAQLDRIVTGYRASLEPDRRYLMSRFAV